LIGAEVGGPKAKRPHAMHAGILCFGEEASFGKEAISAC